MSENSVVNACIRWLHLNGCFVWRNNSGATTKKYTNKQGVSSEYHVRFGAKGSPDIVGTTPTGRFIGVECKFGRNKLDDHQKAFGNKLIEKNALFIVAYSVDDLEAHKQEIVA